MQALFCKKKPQKTSDVKVQLKHQKVKVSSLSPLLSMFPPFPGYHTLAAVLALRCFPPHTFLQYVDHGFLQLTETFLSRLMKGTEARAHTQTHTWHRASPCVWVNSVTGNSRLRRYERDSSCLYLTPDANTCAGVVHVLYERQHCCRPRR